MITIKTNEIEVAIEGTLVVSKQITEDGRIAYFTNTCEFAYTSKDILSAEEALKDYHYDPDEEAEGFVYEKDTFNFFDRQGKFHLEWDHN